MSMTPLSYYVILNLPSTLQHEHSIPIQTLRSAYRRALLHHHPDKANHAVKGQARKDVVFSVDQIAEAFAVLSNPKRRKEYERYLKLQGNDLVGNGKLENNGEGHWKTGIEVVDLDDLNSAEGDGEEMVWYKGCRCGDEKGFIVEEGELEGAADVGEREVLVGCKGCSLWLRVLFGVVDEGRIEQVLEDEQKDGKS